MNTSLKQKGQYSLRIDTSFLAGRAYLAQIYDAKNNLVAQLHCANDEARNALQWFASHQDAEICGWMQMLLDIYLRLGNSNNKAASAIRDLIQADELNNRAIEGLRKDLPKEKGIAAFAVGLKKLENYNAGCTKLRDFLMGLPHDNISNAIELFRNMGPIKKDEACTLKIDDRTLKTEEPEAATPDFDYAIVLREGVANGMVAVITDADLHEIIKTPLKSVKGTTAIKKLVQRDSIACVAACKDFTRNLTERAFNCDLVGIHILEFMQDENKTAEAKNAELAAIAESAAGRDAKIEALSGSFKQLFAFEGLAQELCDIISDSDLTKIGNLATFLSELQQVMAERKNILLEDQVPPPTSRAHEHNDELGRNGRPIFLKN